MKHFISLELRYSTSINVDGWSETQHYTKKLTSELFDTKEEAVKFGNELIANNLWVEQYPGYTGSRLSTTPTGDLVLFHLKNGAEIFIKINKIDEPSQGDLHNLLQIVKADKL